MAGHGEFPASHIYLSLIYFLSNARACLHLGFFTWRDEAGGASLPWQRASILQWQRLLAQRSRAGFLSLR